MYLYLLYIRLSEKYLKLFYVSSTCMYESSKTDFFFFFMCVKTCTYKNVSRCAETWYFMPGVKFYCLVVKERVYSGNPDTTLTMVILSKECSI